MSVREEEKEVDEREGSRRKEGREEKSLGQHHGRRNEERRKNSLPSSHHYLEFGIADNP